MTLAYDRRGSGEPLVLIHGVGSRWQVWARVLDALAAGGRDVIAMDLPGFGESPPDGTEPTIIGQAERVERFFEEIGVERPHVAGNSMGGAIALELARRGSVRSATAVSPAGFWTDAERVWCQRSLRNASRLLGALRPISPLLFSNPVGKLLMIQVFSRPWRQTAEELLLTVDGALGASSFDAAVDAFSGHRFGRPEELRGIPVTIAWGDRDWLLIPRQAGRARRMLPWASHVTLHGCGHSPFPDDPGLLARVLLEGSRS